jgi:hypothetical protein
MFRVVFLAHRPTHMSRVPEQLLPAARPSAVPPCSVAQLPWRLLAPVPVTLLGGSAPSLLPCRPVGLPPAASATPPVRLPCRGARLLATSPPYPGLHPPCSVRWHLRPPSLPTRYDGASLLPCSVARRFPAPCQAATVMPPADRRCVRPV